jgi:hypothetical protein
MTKFSNKNGVLQDVPVDQSFDMDNIFGNDNNNPNDAVKEIFTSKNVKVKSDLSSSQISKISRAYYLAKILDMRELESLLDEFVTLRISKDRKSRSEFVEGLKAKIDNSVLTGGLRQQFGK